MSSRIEVGRYADGTSAYSAWRGDAPEIAVSAGRSGKSRLVDLLAVSTDRAFVFDAKDTDENTHTDRPPARRVRSLRNCQPAGMTDNNPPVLTGPLAPLFLPGIAGTIVAELRANGFNPHGVLCLAEEAGEAIGAFRRYAGRARRTGTLDELGAELADVVITSYVSAHAMLVDLDAVIGTISSRNDPNADPDPLVQALFIQAGRFVEIYPHADARFALAGVVVAARSVAAALDIDLDAAIRSKLAVVFTRIWREGGDQS